MVLTPSPGFFDIPPYNEPRGLNWTTSVVSTFKGHGAIASWYICDERPVQYLPVLQARHELVQRLDPSHITYSVLDRGDNIGMYTNISESLGVDPYPYHHDGDNVTQEVAEINDLLTSLRGVDDHTSICVTQIFGWSNYGSSPDFREPPAAAKRAMALGAFALGCRGVVLYSYYDLFLTFSAPNTPFPNRTRAPDEVIARRLMDLKLLGQEVKALEEVLLGEVADASKLVAAPPDGVVVGMRCPRKLAGLGDGDGAGDGSCTLFVCNMTPRSQVVEVAGAAAVRLGPFDVAILTMPRQGLGAQ